ncbi:hypothetical protein [Enteroccous phage Ef212]|nr:hypothetical protein [Enteroccous phage Ef212]
MRILSTFQSLRLVIIHVKANKNTPEKRCF